nr:VWA domain-containing protein [Solimonas terrae]
MIDASRATHSRSPDESLAVALSKVEIEDAPLAFGEIRAREWLAGERREGGAGASAGSEHVPRRQRDARGEWPEVESEDAVDDVASSPVGGGGGIGRLLQNLLERVRQLKGGGAPGADAATHLTRSGSRAGVVAVRSSRTAESVDDAFGKGTGIAYPEWDTHRGGYRPDWCTVQEAEPPIATHATVAWLDGHELRRPLARLGMGLDRFHRQPQGDDIDIDAAIEMQLERLAGSSPQEAVYVESQRHRRDLSVLVLLDISGSVSQIGPAGTAVHDQQRSVAAALLTVLHEIGDRVSLYAFSSRGRSAVELVPVKRFDDALDSRVMSRLRSLVPGAYSRLGAAIRHGTHLLLTRAGTPRKLLVVLSDGLAYDHGYEPVYGAADARQALGEARRDGVACLCLSVGAGTDVETLRRVFGSAAHATVPSPGQLHRVVGPLFRSALRGAEGRRRAA